MQNGAIKVQKRAGPQWSKKSKNGSKMIQIWFKNGPKWSTIVKKWVLKMVKMEIFDEKIEYVIINRSPLRSQSTIWETFFSDFQTLWLIFKLDSKA